MPFSWDKDPANTMAYDMLIAMHLLIYLEGFTLRGRWSITTMVKQVLALLEEA